MGIKKGKILWVDDEIDLLKSHILFLKSKGFDVIPVTNGADAVKLVNSQEIDLVLLDEMMAGMDGLTALKEIKKIYPGLPVIMITKSEEEVLMEKAIGGKITDYLIKPVNPNQILMACKKILEQQRITSEHVSQNYLQEFHKISARLYDDLSWTDWCEIYNKLVKWDIEFESYPDLGLKETLDDQVRDCNIEFGKYIEKNYKTWLKEDIHFRPTLSPDIMKKHVFPLMKSGKKVLFIVIDCLRMDQWLAFESLLYDYFNIDTNYCFSILPSATPYSRNAIFSGLFPDEIQKNYPDIWQKDVDDEFSLNRHEGKMIKTQFERENIRIPNGLKYFKILDADEGWATDKKISSFLGKSFISLVINFVDIIAHRRSDSAVLKEIVPNETTYREVVHSWFKHSWLFSVLRRFSEQNFHIVLTSDHGSVRVQNDVRVVGDRQTSSNIRFKYGTNLNCPPKYALEIKKPSDYKLPSFGINTNYLIAKENFYFVYPTNYHKFQSHYKDTFQHGGISMEELILPVIKMTPKKNK